jgi:hypothetical protein
LQHCSCSRSRDSASVANSLAKRTVFETLPILFTFVLLMNAWQAVRWYRVSHRRAERDNKPTAPGRHAPA